MATTSTERPSRPQHPYPLSVASAESRRTWPELDIQMLSGAVTWALARLRASLLRHGLAAALFTDPVNVRYATGTSLMPVWTLHSIDRYVLVPADGEPVLFEYAKAPPGLVRPYPMAETRPAISWSAFGSGEHAPRRAADFAADVVAVLRPRGLQDGRIGVDRMDAYGFLALQEAGLELAPAQLAVEQARAVKGPDEIELLRRSVAVADQAVTHLYENLRPGLTENEVWADFCGTAFAAGGEFVECRLLASGPRTNPWFHEASDRRIERGDVVSFDTDLIGPAGYLADLSRAYLVGSTTPTPRQQRLYADARDFLSEIITELKPGAAFDELGERLSRRFPARYQAQRYPFIAHGSGLADEYPIIGFADHHEGEIEAGMVVSIEAYVGAESEDEGMKVEEQVLVTSDGVELLSHAPHDEHLAAGC